MNEEVEHQLFVEVNSLDDWAKGKKLFSEFKLEHYRHVDFQAMGIVEGGTKKGRTSVAFLLKDARLDSYYMAEFPLAILETLAALAINTDLSFQNQNTPSKQEAN